MILGGGISPSVPIFTLGFEHKPASSNVSLRLMTEYYERAVSDPTTGGFFSLTKMFGLQALGVRTFRLAHRFQPYVLGGAGLYYDDSMYRPSTFSWNGNGLELSSSSEIRQRQSVIPTVLWGTGLNVRVSGLTLFGEVKFPMYAPQVHRFRFGPQAPLTFGFRF